MIFNRLSVLLFVSSIFCIQFSLARPLRVFQVGHTAPSTFRLHVSGVQAKNKAYEVALKRAFDAASKIWRSSVPVDVRIDYRVLNSEEYAKSEPFFLPIDGNTQSLQTAAWEAILRSNSTKPFDADITINVNPRIKWHVGESEPPADAMDLSTVVMHELYHNLFLSGNIRVKKQGDSKIAFLDTGIPARFDRFLVNKQGCSILGYLTDTKLQQRLVKSGPELLKAAVSNGELYFMGQDPSFKVKLHAPKSYAGFTSVYHVADSNADAPSLMQPKIQPGVRILSISPDILRMQNMYINRDIPGGRTCAFTLDNPYPRGHSSRSLKQRRKIGGVPTWVFGLCMVLLVIVFVILLFAICTAGALAKQKEKPSIWKQCTCCCTGIEDGKDAQPVFMYIDDSTAKQAQSTRNSTEVANVVMHADPVPHVPVPPPHIEVSTRDPSVDQASSASLMSQPGLESQLPPRFYM